VAYLTQDQRSASLPASRLHRMSVPVIADIVSPENFKKYGKDFLQGLGPDPNVFVLGLSDPGH
jgi:hypothetical protein